MPLELLLVGVYSSIALTDTYGSSGYVGRGPYQRASYIGFGESYPSELFNQIHSTQVELHGISQGKESATVSKSVVVNCIDKSCVYIRVTNIPFNTLFCSIGQSV